MTASQHPLVEHPEETRIDYLCVIATLAAADQRISDDELTQLRLFCETVEVGAVGVGTVLAAAADPTLIDLPAVVAHFTATALKFTLLTDLLLMTHADDTVASEEKSLLNEIISGLGMTTAQMQAIAGYVTNLRAAQAYRRGYESKWRRIGGETAETLKREGIPLKSVTAADIMNHADTRSEGALAFLDGVLNGERR